MKKLLLLAATASTLILTGCTWMNTSSDAMMKKDEAMMSGNMDKDHMMKDDKMMTGSSTGMIKDDKIMNKDDDSMMKKNDAMMQKDSMKK